MLTCDEQDRYGVVHRLHLKDEVGEGQIISE